MSWRAWTEFVELGLKKIISARLHIYIQETIVKKKFVHKKGGSRGPKAPMWNRRNPKIRVFEVITGWRTPVFADEAATTVWIHKIHLDKYAYQVWPWDMEKQWRSRWKYESSTTVTTKKTKNREKWEREWRVKYSNECVYCRFGVWSGEEWCLLHCCVPEEGWASLWLAWSNPGPR